MTKPFFLLAAFCFAAAAIVDDEQAKALPAGAGKEVVAKICLDCHNAGHFRGQRLTAEEWTSKVSEMVDQGAKATDEEASAVVAYLVKNFGKDSKVQMNTAPAVELRAVLGFSAPESDLTVAYRKDHPAFQEWRDVLKVPGIDAAKVEAKKELMLF
jgi:competence protein ComEA